MNRYPQLDTFRGFAAVAVVADHFLFATDSVVNSFLQLGKSAVAFFFVLSGFLITSILLRQRFGAAEFSCGAALRVFYARRILRIFPIYYLSLLLVYPISQKTQDTILWHLLYGSNILFSLEQKFPGAPLSHLWSLAVEEQFYIFWPFLLFLVPARILPQCVAATVLIGPLFRFAVLQATGNWMAAFLLLPGCVDYLGAGAVLAFWRADRRYNAEVSQRWIGRAAILAGAAWIVLRYLAMDHNLPDWAAALQPTCAIVVYLWLIHGGAIGWKGRARTVLNNRFLLFVGQVSYGLYLYHLLVPPLLFAAQKVLHVPLFFPHEDGPLRFCYGLAVTLAAASTSYYVIEMPLLKLKSRFPYLESERGQKRTGKSSLAPVAASAAE